MRFQALKYILYQWHGFVIISGAQTLFFNRNTHNYVPQLPYRRITKPG